MSDNYSHSMTKEHAIAAIKRLSALARECEKAGLTGAALDNERTISLLRSVFDIQTH